MTRSPLLAAGAVALAAGLYSALLLLGLPLPVPTHTLAEVHGPLMVLGFIGTLVALERAVALGTRWALSAPAFAGLGALALILTGDGLTAKILLMIASVVLLGIYRDLWRRQATVGLLAQAAGAFAWYGATLLWLGGFPVPDLVPWLATFLITTIAGERVELSRITASGQRTPVWFTAAVAGLLLGATAATVWPTAGYHVFGLGLLAVAAWLIRFDPARHLLAARGLPRYVAIGLSAGYGWLVVAGVLWAGAGSTVDGPRYDATLHAVFLGFGMSMIFVHAPVILPAILRRPLPYHRLLYAPLVLLHLGLLVRIGLGDGAGLAVVWRWAGVANVAAVLGFGACAAALAVRAGLRQHPTVARPAVAP